MWVLYRDVAITSCSWACSWHGAAHVVCYLVSSKPRKVWKLETWALQCTWQPYSMARHTVRYALPAAASFTACCAWPAALPACDAAEFACAQMRTSTIRR